MLQPTEGARRALDLLDARHARVLIRGLRGTYDHVNKPRVDSHTGEYTRLRFADQAQVMTACAGVATYAVRRGATAAEVWELFQYDGNRLTLYFREAWRRVDFDAWLDELARGRAARGVRERVPSPAEAWAAVFDAFAQAVEPRTFRRVDYEVGELNWQGIERAADMATRFEFVHEIREPGDRLGILQQMTEAQPGRGTRVRLTVPPAEAVELLRAESAAWATRKAAEDAEKRRKAVERARVRSVSVSASRTKPAIDPPVGGERSSETDAARSLVAELLPVLALDSTPTAPQAQPEPLSFADLLTNPANAKTHND